MTKIIINFFFGDQKSQNCLEVGRTPEVASSFPEEGSDQSLREDDWQTAWPVPKLQKVRNFLIAGFFPQQFSLKSA